MINNIKFFFKNLNNKEKKTICITLIYVFFIAVIVGYFLFKFEFINLFFLDFFNIFFKNIDAFYSENKIIFILIFSFSVIIWVLLLGFISPIMLLGGYIFGPLLSSLIIALSHAIAATIFFIIVRNFFKTILKKIVTKKLKLIINFLNKDINHYFLFYRILGDFGTPPPLNNLIPIFTKIKIKYYFTLTFVGTIPFIYVWSNLGQSIRYVSELNEINFSIIANSNIYISIIHIIDFYYILLY